VVGGGTAPVIKAGAEPLPLINAFSELQKKDSTRERTLFSVCTGSLFLAKQGILSGLSATTHPDFITTLEIVCSEVARDTLGERTDVVDDARYVVNNLRFDLGDEDENPYVRSKADTGARPPNARYVSPKAPPA
jgi:putative intracellular protease/amidase